MITNKQKTLKLRLNQQGSRLTKQRQIILDYLAKVSCHPSAEKVYQEVRKNLPRISLGTVYRNLNYLTTQGFIKQLKTSNNKFHFDGNYHDHLHFICQRCNRIYDLGKSQFLKSLKNYSAGSVQRIECYLYGFCQKCKK